MNGMMDKGQGLYSRANLAMMVSPGPIPAAIRFPRPARPPEARRPGSSPGTVAPCHVLPRDASTAAADALTARFDRPLPPSPPAVCVALGNVRRASIGSSSGGWASRNRRAAKAFDCDLLAATTGHVTPTGFERWLLQHQPR